MDAPYYNGPPTHLPGEGLDDPPVYECERCGEETSQVYDVQTARQTMSSPAEWERLCSHCAEPFIEHDPQDREPDEDALEERRRR